MAMSIKLQQQDLDRLDSRGIRRGGQLMDRLTIEVLRRVRAGVRDVSGAIDAFRPDLIALAQGAGLAAHLTGVLRVRTQLKRELDSIEPKGLAIDAVFQTSVEFIKRRLKLTTDQVAALEKKYGDQAVRVVNTFSKNVNDKVSRAIGEVVAKNLPARAGVKLVQESLGAAGITRANRATLEALVRTNVQTGYGAGRWQAAQDPDIQDLLWGWEYVTVGDDRVRPNHEIMDGARYPKDDPFWRKNWPPNGWNCRCSTVEILVGDADARKKQAKQKTIDGEVVKPEADEGFQFNPGELFNDVLAIGKK